ncbi:hypothetical protein [Sphingomonas hankyongi]|uniref:Uncharacterized protein n=1 Tax=Sphingomonas hankyongi TaxID=2908209 RepID=A0ABT0RY78_9SPHN|nr:hypothetical protein [Sphingomonas hankyongi]MCL6728565.1 hypothetical protein [Sphingomonas hankyongi]
MAAFCETLAETAVVAEACDAAGMSISGAYAARRRNPAFAAAWAAALAIARERLADTLLARSIEGNIEQIWRDGELVGERHVLDNRLGLAILRRLDRLAETGLTVSTRGERSLFPGEGRVPGQRETFDWELAIGALRVGDDEGVAHALGLFEGSKGHKVEEVEDPPVSLIQGDREEAGLDLSDRCWRDEESLDEPVWMTDFPPPPGFAGYEIGNPADTRYHRECTPEEAAILDASEAAAAAEARAEEEQLRDAWFDMLRAECSEADAGASPEHESKLADFLEPDLVAELPGGGGASDGADFLDGQ